MAKPKKSGEVKTSERGPAELIVNNDTLQRLYGIVLRCRMAAESGAGVPAIMEGATSHAAAIVELTPQDSVSSTRPSLAVELAHGALLAEALRRLMSSGPAETVNGSGVRLLPRGAAGTSQLAVAAGVALAGKLSGPQPVVVVLADGDAVCIGPAYEALDYAAAHKLPLMVVADHAGSRKSSDLSSLAQAHGVPGFVVDGGDAVAVYRVAREAINRARAGRGPSFIECRKLDNTEDPLRHLERYLAKHGLWSPERKRELVREIERELRATGSKR